ncbi:MAG: four helix bundle protein [Lentimicrobium sp.]|mgnify:FL=1|jgi:four helix bundle protein|nr:four helix bundle protein [Lentimicrobium sp.]MDY0027168.1 four helix bundle protein [Lentimicrobium sp.]HAH60281.1 diversity-generating retroelement protein bAvd family protein [Bacteroidales bacterium]
MRDFRNLAVWQKSVEFAKEIYRITEQFPGKERYGLCSQLQRAAVSIPSSIAEGSSRRTSIDFARFLDIAIGSAFEVETQLIISNQIGYLEKETFEKLLAELAIIQKQTNRLRTAILEPPLSKG